MNLKDQFEAMLKDELRDTAFDFQKGTAEIAAYMAKRAEHLANAAGEPGFSYAVLAERNSVALFAGINAAKRLGRLEQRLFGMLQGSLRIGAIFLAEAAAELDPGEAP